MQDQLVLFMALAAGSSRMLCVEPTLHTRTAMVVAEQMLPGVKFTLSRGQGRDGKLTLVECAGAGVACGESWLRREQGELQ